MSKSKPVDSKHQAALAARRLRDKKARETLADSYIRQLIRKKHPELGLNVLDIHPDYVAATKLHLAMRRRLWERNTPEMDAAMTAYIAALSNRIGSKPKRRGRL